MLSMCLMHAAPMQPAVSVCVRHSALSIKPTIRHVSPSPRRDAHASVQQHRDQLSSEQMHTGTALRHTLHCHEHAPSIQALHPLKQIILTAMSGEKATSCRFAFSDDRVGSNTRISAHCHELNPPTPVSRIRLNTRPNKHSLRCACRRWERFLQCLKFGWIGAARHLSAAGIMTSAADYHMEIITPECFRSYWPANSQHTLMNEAVA